MKYVCDVCGYVYDETVGDPDNGIAPGTKWEDLPEDFECPVCGVGREQFSKEDQRKSARRSVTEIPALISCFKQCYKPEFQGSFCIFI